MSELILSETLSNIADVKTNPRQRQKTLDSAAVFVLKYLSINLAVTADKRQLPVLCFELR